MISTESIIEILRLSPQNDIAMQSLKGEESSSSPPLRGISANSNIPSPSRGG